MDDDIVRWFAAVDWGSEQHQACILDAAGKIMDDNQLTLPNFGKPVPSGIGIFSYDAGTGKYVYDAANGKILYQTRLPTAVQGYPITYAVNGRQYIAVPVGTGGGAWQGGIISDVEPEQTMPPPTNSIFVFALPDAAAKR